MRVRLATQPNSGQNPAPSPIARLADPQNPRVSALLVELRVATPQRESRDAA